MKKVIVTVFLTFFVKSAFAYNIYLINNLPDDPINDSCNAIHSFYFYNSPSSEFPQVRIEKSYTRKPLLAGKRRLLARNRPPEVLALGYILIHFDWRFVFNTKCLGSVSPEQNILLKPELLSSGYRDNIELTPTIDTRPIKLGNEVFETVSVKLKVSRLPGAMFNVSVDNDVVRITYIVKRKSTTTDAVNITKGLYTDFRQRLFIT